MKLSDAEKLQLYGRILAALLPLKIRSTPPPKGGKPKGASWEFGTACWAQRVCRSAIYVLEHEETDAQRQAAHTASPEVVGTVDGDVPF